MHQISELSNNQWKTHFISDNRNIQDLLSKIDMILVDKNLDDCAFDSNSIIKEIQLNYPTIKIIVISGSPLEDNKVEYPFLLKDDDLVQNIFSFEKMYHASFNN